MARDGRWQAECGVHAASASGGRGASAQARRVTRSSGRNAAHWWRGPTPRVTLPREFETVPRMKWITREPRKVNRVAGPPLFRS